MNKNILRSSFIALFAAIICIGCFMRIPLGPVPIVLQNMLCILTAVILGGIYGGAPSLLFIIAGVIGLPVFSGGTSGYAVLVGPTGGFIIGYFVGAVVAALIAGKPSVEEKKLTKVYVIRICVAVFAGMVILYVPGVIHFVRWASRAGKVPVGQSAFAYTMGACVIPFIPGDILKILICIPVAVKIRPVLAQYFGEPIIDEDEGAEESAE